MKLRAVAALALAGILATSCGAKGADEAAERDREATENSTGGDTGENTGGEESSEGKFGNMESPCGPGNATIAPEDAGLGTDKLRIGVANNREGIYPGLLKELWDASSAFVEWCNSQGGIAGIELEAVDLVVNVPDVEAGMAKACSDVFAMVGGGYAVDNLIFNGREDADFHECGMIAFPGFAVSTDFSEASDQVQPLPNPARRKAVGYYHQLKELYPDLIANFGTAYGELPSIKQNSDQVIGQAKTVEGFGQFDAISYPMAGADWAVVTKQIQNAGIKMLSFVGEYQNLAGLSQALRDQGWEGVITADANQYDLRLIKAQGPDAVEGVVIRLAAHPFEEADKWPATKQLVEILDRYSPDWRNEQAALTVQSFSANLLFAQSVKNCVENGDGTITRKCVLEEAKKITSWTGGGLHADANPGENEPPRCSMLVVIKGGTFERLYPEIGGEGDDGDGFSCQEVITVEGDFGQGNTSKSILDN